MTIDATHRPWIIATVVLAIAATAGYLVYAAKVPGGPSGGSLPGLLYGVAGSVLMLYAGLLSGRKQVPTWRVGRAQTWLRGHIWLGLLSVPLILFHSAFRWGGRLEQALWALFILIVISGVFGLALQQFLPQLMTRLLPLETIYEQIGHVCQVMQGNADLAVASVCGPLGIELHAESAEPAGKRRSKAAEPQPGSAPLKEFYLQEVRPFLASTRLRSSRFASAARAAATFDQIRIMIPPPLHETLDQLASFCEERRQLLLQARLHHLLHSWLFVHVPLSVALLVLGVAHAVVALWY